MLIGTDLYECSEESMMEATCWGYIYLRLVNTKGVALGKLRTLAIDCSFPSLVGSSVLPEPEKGQNPLDLEPLPPIFSCSTLFSWVTGLPVVLQCYCTRWNVTLRIWNLRKVTHEREELSYLRPHIITQAKQSTINILFFSIRWEPSFLWTRKVIPEKDHNSTLNMKKTTNRLYCNTCAFALLAIIL